MPSVAAWLLARPQNAIFALVLAMLMPGLAMLSGSILLLTVLQQDVRRASLVAVAAATVLLAIELVAGAFDRGGSALQLAIQVAFLWLPILGLSMVMRKTGSLTLTLQLSVMFVLIGVCLFFAQVNDPVVFWQDLMAADPLLQNLSGSLQQWQLMIGATDSQFAAIVVAMFAINAWYWLVAIIMLGYWMYSQLPDKSPQFGRFRDLNFGRVVAVLLAVTSVFAFVFDAAWMLSIALILFAVFWLQAAAMAHWLKARGIVPIFAVSAVYVLTILLPQYVFPALAVLGYTDAWFRYRDRATQQQ
jgi:hypothetical protein